MDAEGKAIAAIYDAAFAENRWNQALDAVLSETTAQSILLYDSGPERGVNYSNQTANTNFARQPFVADYNSLFNGDRDSNYDAEAAAIVHSKLPHIGILDEECFTLDQAFRSRPEIRFTIDRMGVYRRFFVNLSDDPLSYSGLIALYSREFTCPPPRRDIRKVEAVSPHLAKVLQMNRTMNGLRRKYRAVLSVLDMIDVPICILDCHGNVILRNRRAGELFSERDGLWTAPNGKLACRSNDVLLALQDATRRMSLTALGENGDSSTSLEIPRASSAVPLFAVAAPLRDADMELEPGLAGALLTIIDSERLASPRFENLCKAYRFTAAEERVVPYLAMGYSNLEMADRLDVGFETIKTHVSAILSKTGCKSRLAFVWRVFQFSPPIL